MSYILIFQLTSCHLISSYFLNKTADESNSISGNDLQTVVTKKLNRYIVSALQLRVK